MSGGNDIIHQAVRLRIMASLNALPQGDAIEFTRLKTLTSATDGNLGSHLDALERAGYVTIEKRFAGKKPQTRVKATPAGRRAFTEHVAYLREILDQSGPIG
ncbi:MAG TPA: transcriptional regulator [Magnetospirillaceae bacterium]|jgi:DNA-binding MarR family transcriptional regulator